jgi:hypothetical protein
MGNVPRLSKPPTLFSGKYLAVLGLPPVPPSAPAVDTDVNGA